MSVDPFLGGASVEIDPLTATPGQVASLASGGIRDRHKPETVVTQKFAARPGLTGQQQVQPPVINRSMIIAGYKGTADAWIRCLNEVLQVNGQQVDRKFYLALDPREADRQAELMAIGSQAFSTFVTLQYRDPIPTNPIGLPAARNLHSFVGKITEEYRNAGPVLIALPFHTMMPGAFDFIERTYGQVIQQKGIFFMGYETKKAEGRSPGATLVLPPNWARHPDFPLAKGLSPMTSGDISFIKDEVLRSMRATEVIVGNGMKPAPTTCIQTFPADEIVINTPAQTAFNPTGRPSVPTAAPNTPVSVREVVNSPQPVAINPTAGPLIFNSEEKEAALLLISQLGIGAVKSLDATRYGITLAADSEFAEATINKAQGFKIRAGKKAKAG